MGPSGGLLTAAVQSAARAGAAQEITGEEIRRVPAKPPNLGGMDPQEAYLKYGKF